MNLDKQYYSIKEVADLFKVNPSKLRYWETQFPHLLPKRTGKGIRKYTPVDIEKISASGGSACSSGTSVGSHVLSALNPSATGAAVRFSFSKNNTKEEIDRVLEVLERLVK